MFRNLKYFLLKIKKKRKIIFFKYFKFLYFFFIVAGGSYRQKEFEIFFLKNFFFHGQRWALQLVNK